MGVPLNHPYLDWDFHEINQPAIGNPHLNGGWETHRRLLQLTISLDKNGSCGVEVWFPPRNLTLEVSNGINHIWHYIKYIYIHWVRPNSCNSQQKDFFIFWANVVLSVFLRAQNRAFRCFTSCKKMCSRSCFLVLSLVHRIVFFGALPRAKNCAFWCSPSCQKPCSRSCFLVLSFVPKIVL